MSLSICQSTILIFAAAVLVSFGGCSTLLPMSGGGDAKTFESDFEGIQQLVADAESAEEKGDLVSAIQSLQNASEIGPNRHDLTHRLATLYDRQGNHEKAEDAYQRAIRALPSDAKLRNDYGVFKLDREQFTEAETLFRQALSMEPDFELATTNLARSLVFQGRVNESYSLFTKVVSAAAAHSNIGVLLLRQGKVDEARWHFSYALKFDPHIEPARSLHARVSQ